MKVSYSLHGLDFEWDSHKATSNLRKHGVSLESAGEVFHDPFIQLVDEETVAGELRESIIGMTVSWRLLYVVYVVREEVIRIISAREATSAERRHYEDQ
ncbi:MAG TPA: BrnT family toxin [Anaerolineae bacterium]|nr:BrnT family toxin [Anaerolineae bacterium]HMR63300.1 BrnT family toxin [Anaerolineae bacterium]